MDANLSCRVCLGDYDEGHHNPVLLPACGHTFCAFCIEQLYWQNKRACPECRKNNAVQRASSLPVNYSVLGIAQARQQKASNHKTASPRSPPCSARHNKPAPSESPTTPRPSPPVATPRVTTSLSADRVGPCHSPLTSGALLQNSPPIARPRRSSSTSSVLPQSSASTSGLRAQHQISDRTVNHFTTNSVSAVRARPPLSSVRHSRSQQSQSEMSDLTSSLSRLQMGPSRQLSQPDMSDLTSTMSRLQMGSSRRPQHSSPHRAQSRDHNTLQEELDFQMAVHLTFCKDSSHRHDEHTGHSGRCWQYPADNDLAAALSLARTQQD